MIYKNHGYNRLLVGDFYHWDLDTIGDFVAKENLSKAKPKKRIETEFTTVNINDITEDLKDE